jgi:hypothetical protein
MARYKGRPSAQTIVRDFPHVVEIRMAVGGLGKRIDPSIGRNVMSLGTILLIVIVIALLGGFSGFGGGPFYGTGY